MSGIVGIYNIDGRPAERADIEGMVHSIAHRGPDGYGVWADGPVGLGHRMLWTTPESLHEKLPFVNKAGDMVITADARIDNREDLFSILNFSGRRKETIGDAEIIMSAYERWGEGSVVKLLGDFAFAIWDERHKRLFCARDSMGVKPFYYYFDGRSFRMGSEPNALFISDAVPKKPNLPLLCSYLLNQFNEHEETMYRGICRLPQAHFLILENGHFRKNRYWDIDPSKTVRHRSDSDYAEHFLMLFKEGVRARLRSYGPIGASLSGGLDSSSIVGVSQSILREDSQQNGFETFSIIFDELPCDERYYIDEVARKWKVHSNCYVYQNYLSEMDFEQIKQYWDMAYFPTLLSFTPALKDAQRKGIRCMLNGDGGDELLASGFYHLTDLLLKGDICKLISHLRNDSLIYSYSPFYLFLNYCFKPLFPLRVKVFCKALLDRLRGTRMPCWANVSFLKKHAIRQTRSCISSIRFQTRSQQRIYEGLHSGWNCSVASEMEERFVSYYGMEIRFPFLDRRLVEFLIAVPEEQRWSVNLPKFILREAMKGILPESIRNRKGKTDYSPVIDLELRERQSHKVEKLIQTSILSKLGLIHIDHFGEMFKQYKKGSYYSFRNTLETFIWLELWLRSQWPNLSQGGEYDSIQM